jgi:hypothetical protein
VSIAALAVICIGQAFVLSVSPRVATGAVLACLRALPAGSLLVTDDQGIAARAGLRTPSWLADTSRVRISSGHLTTGEIVAHGDGAVGVLFAPPSRAKFVEPEIAAWARRAFPVTYRVDGYLLAVPASLACPA